MEHLDFETCEYRAGLLLAQQEDQEPSEKELLKLGFRDGKKLRYINRYLEIPLRCAICKTFCRDLFYSESKFSPVHLTEKQNYQVGGIIGASIGDAMGFPLEGMSKQEMQEVLSSPIFGFIETFRYPGGVYSDDTELITFAMESIVSGQFDERKCIQSLSLWLENNPRTPGRGVQSAVDFYRKELKEDPRPFINGNGAAVSVVPLALENLGDDAYVKFSKLTHAHPDSLAAVVCQANLIQYCMKKTKETFNRDEIASIMLDKSLLYSKDYHAKLHFAFHSFNKNASRIIQKLGCGHEVIEGAVTAQYIALKNYKSFERAILTAINSGGDSDSVGAMVGAPLGALHGFKSIPQDWIDELENQDALIQKTLSCLK